MLFATGPFETKEPVTFDLSVFNTKMGEQNIKAANNQKIKCRYVCDKKLYKQQKIADAISFYENQVK